MVASVPERDGRARVAFCSRFGQSERSGASPTTTRTDAKKLLDAILGREGLAGLWLEGDDDRTGLSSQIEDVSSDIVNALRQRFTAYLSGRSAMPFDARELKRCILCNEPVDSVRRVNTASRAHGIKTSAFSGRDGRNDHLASPSGDTHLCPVCHAELQLRQNAQDEFRGSGDLPPLISSPVTLGLFGRVGVRARGIRGIHGASRPQPARNQEGLGLLRARLPDTAYSRCAAGGAAQHG